jgi:hypothetical protein
VLDPKNPTVPVAKNNPRIRRLPVRVKWNPIPVPQIALFAPIGVDDAVATIVRCHASEAAPTFAIDLAVAAAQVALLGAIDLAVAAEGPDLAPGCAGAIALVGVQVAVVTLLARRNHAVATDGGLASVLSAVCARLIAAGADGTVPAGLGQAIAGAPVTVVGVAVVAG